MSKILYFQFLTDGDSGANKKVKITDKEYESLKPCRGFPHEIDTEGGRGYPVAPEWVRCVKESTPNPMDRPAVEGPIDATILIY
jgi:hypothetical protein